MDEGATAALSNWRKTYIRAVIEKLLEGWDSNETDVNQVIRGDSASDGENRPAAVARITPDIAVGPKADRRSRE